MTLQMNVYAIKKQLRMVRTSDPHLIRAFEREGLVTCMRTITPADISRVENKNSHIEPNTFH